MSARLREDRLLRWSIYAAVPFAWLALALISPIFLFVPALIALALWTAMRVGVLERFESADEPDLF